MRAYLIDLTIITEDGKRTRRRLILCSEQESLNEVIYKLHDRVDNLVDTYKIIDDLGSNTIDITEDAGKQILNI